MKYQPKHLKGDLPEGQKPAKDPQEQAERPGVECPDRVHPLGIPYPDTDGEGEFIPIPGDTRADFVTPSGAVVRNPWSEQPEIDPDYAYTDEQEDQDLLIM